MAIPCSVGVTAYNEEANIGKLLHALLTQELAEVEIREIIVVASGCTDRTVETVREYAASDPRISLIEQPQREGKTSAINLFLARAQNEICVLESGDTLPGHDTIENLVLPFADPQVGMTGAQKIPTNVPEHVVGYMSHLRLRLEHQLCLEIPRLGELIAFRRVFSQLPPDVAMDEAFVEALVIRRGLLVKYAPQAVVYNTGPETLGEFLMQRRRNYAGHLHLKHKYGYRVSSLDSGRVGRIAAEEVINALRLIVTLFWLAVVEFTARILGWYDYYVRDRKHVVWDMAWTTKEVNEPPALKETRGSAAANGNGRGMPEAVATPVEAPRPPESLERGTPLR